MVSCRFIFILLFHSAVTFSVYNMVHEHPTPLLVNKFLSYPKRRFFQRVMAHEILKPFLFYCCEYSLGNGEETIFADLPPGQMNVALKRDPQRPNTYLVRSNFRSLTNLEIIQCNVMVLHCGKRLFKKKDISLSLTLLCVCLCVRLCV